MRIVQLNSFSASVTASLIRMTASIEDHEERVAYLEGIGGISGGNPLTPLNQFSASAKISIANLEAATGSYETTGRGIISGSSQVDVMSTTNIARLATTGSNSFNGSQTITGSVTVSSTLNASSILVNGFLGIDTGADVNSVKIGRSTGGTSTRTVAIGYGSAGGAGSYNVAIGDQSGQQLAGSNNVVIGGTTLNATINASSNTIVGSSTANTNAIGSTNTIIGSGITLGAGAANNTIVGASVTVGAISNHIILANGAGTRAFIYDGTNTTLTNNVIVSGSISATGDIVAYSTSDIRFKENIIPITAALLKLENISGNTYDWKNEFEYIHGFKGNDVGVIAQEIQKVLPEAVRERENGYLGVNYEKIIPLLIESIKELSAKVDRLENK